MPDREDSSTRSWDAVAEDWVGHADENDYRERLRHLTRIPYFLFMSWQKPK
jgi:hypothetical protein